MPPGSLGSFLTSASVQKDCPFSERMCMGTLLSGSWVVLRRSVSCAAFGSSGEKRFLHCSPINWSRFFPKRRSQLLLANATRPSGSVRITPRRSWSSMESMSSWLFWTWSSVSLSFASARVLSVMSRKIPRMATGTPLLNWQLVLPSTVIILPFLETNRVAMGSSVSPSRTRLKAAMHWSRSLG